MLCETVMEGPSLLVSIGSGISVVKMEPTGRYPFATMSAPQGTDRIEVGSGAVVHLQPGRTPSPLSSFYLSQANVSRVNGCSIGGATFLGLARLITKFTSFDEAVAAAEKGRNTPAMYVSDIYGGKALWHGVPQRPGLYIEHLPR